MTVPGREDRSEPNDRDTVTAEETFALPDEVVRNVMDAIDRGDTAKVEEIIQPLHYADVADLLEHLSASDRRLCIDIIRPQLEPETLSELDEDLRAEVVEQLGTKEVAAAISELATDDAVTLIDSLSEEARQEVLDAVPLSNRVMVQQGLAYPEDSAGRIMQREFVAVPQFWTVGEIIDYLRATEDLPDDFYDLFVVDPRHRPVGTVPLSRVLRTTRPVSVGEIMEAKEEFFTVLVSMDQEEVAFLFRQQDLVSVPVVDDGGRLVGVITIDDVVDVIDEEHEEDLMHLGGVSEDDLYRAVLATTKSRFSWLVVNLGTAIIASLVIAVFEATIEQIVALAVLMPIVASMGGNAGTQTLTVAVRALATHELTPANALRVIGKEILVGGVNGVLFAILAAVVAGVWFDSVGLGLVMAAAMVINLLVAGLAGTLIPLGLALRGVDPAVASAVFLTTLTDVVGFFAFLGLAAWFLL